MVPRLLFLIALGCSAPDRSASGLVLVMSLEEKVDQLHGSGVPDEDGFWTTAANDRLGLPALRMTDGPRGVTAGVATTFPVAMARGATWDVDLEERIGEAMGAEVAARGGNVLLAPAMNILRHPAWGRAQETYGEDVHHLGAFAVAAITGIQRHVMASAKHFAANSIEDTRFDVDVQIAERPLHEVYLPHFERAVREADVASVMSAYNLVNGAYCSENAPLLGILKDTWGFEGFVESDWIFGTRSTVPAITAGLDIEMPGDVYFGDDLVAAVRAGEVPEATVDEAVLRVVGRKLAYADRSDPGERDHGPLALEAAEKSLVLLKNTGALPLPAGASVALAGPLADVANLGDNGSSATEPPYAVTPRQGLDEAGVLLVDDPALADAAVVVVGLTGADEGENILPGIGGDRDSLALSADDRALIEAIAAQNDRTIVVIEAGSAITVEGWIEEVEAVIHAWYPGQEGGTALARVLTGAVNPSGRMPVSTPVDEADLPPFDHTSLQVTYGLLHGYRWLADRGAEARFPFGFGLSFTTFAYSDLSVTVRRDTVEVEVAVTNTGDRAGDEVVQVYVASENKPRELRAFGRIALEPGETDVAALSFDAGDLAWWNGGWVLESGPFHLDVGGLSESFEVR